MDEKDLMKPVSPIEKADLLRHVGSYMPDFEDNVRRLCAQNDILQEVVAEADAAEDAGDFVLWVQERLAAWRK